MWSGSSPGPAAQIGDRVDQARQGSTVRLGGLLAPYAIRYVVVVDTLAPSIPGFQSPLEEEPPADLEPALLSQLDLRQIIGQGGFDVFIDDAALPERAVLATAKRPTATSVRKASPAPTPSPVGSDPALVGWTPALEAPRGASEATGRVPAGTVLAAVAPARSWELVDAAGRVHRSDTLFGYAASFTVTRPGVVTVKFRGSWVHGLEITLEALLWLVAVGILLGRRRSLSRLSSRIRRRHARRAQAPGPELRVDEESAREPVGAGGAGR
jgi:hypothetical protein